MTRVDCIKPVDTEIFAPIAALVAWIGFVALSDFSHLSTSLALLS